MHTTTKTPQAEIDFEAGKPLYRRNGTPTAEQMRTRPMLYNGWLWAIGFSHGCQGRAARFIDEPWYEAGRQAGKSLL
jgi:hypothetical protein